MSHWCRQQKFYPITLWRSFITELHLSVYWHTVRVHISRGSLAGLIANKSPVVQECNYLLTQIILLAGSHCLCSGTVTPGTESSHITSHSPLDAFIIQGGVWFSCLCDIQSVYAKWRLIYHSWDHFVISLCNVQTFDEDIQLPCGLHVDIWLIHVSVVSFFRNTLTITAANGTFLTLHLEQRKLYKPNPSHKLKKSLTLLVIFERDFRVWGWARLLSQN